MACFTVLLVLSISCISATSAAVPVQAKLSGEKPQFDLMEQWRYNFVFTKDGSSVQAKVYANTTGLTGRHNDYYGNMIECCNLTFKPLDPCSIFPLMLMLDALNITDLTVNEVLEIGNNSMLNVLVSKDDFKLVATQWVVKYDGAKKLNLTLVWYLNELPLHVLQLPLSDGKEFGNYAGALNVSLGGYFHYYNGSQVDYESASLEESVVFPDTSLLFYPLFVVEGIETVTVTAGQYECWSISVRDPTNKDNEIGHVWYSPSVKNVVKLNLTSAFQGSNYELYVELESYSSQESPVQEVPPVSAWLASYFVVGSFYQAQQRNMLLLGGLAAVIAAGVLVALVAVRRRR